MGSSDLRRLLLLAAVWGGSYVFIRVAVRDFGAVCTVETRTLIAGLVLLAYARATRTPMELRQRWRQYLLLGALQSAIPFLLISSAEVHITASMAAILNATTPLFAAIVAAAWLKDPLTGTRILGIAVAFSGVVLLVGIDQMVFDRPTVIGIGSCLAAACCYGVAGAYSKAVVRGGSPVGMAAGSQLSAAAIVFPLVFFSLPHSVPSMQAIACVLTLALAATAFAYILYFRLLVDLGPAKALTVTFLMPGLGVLWGTVLLHEPITIGKVLGCATILAGTYLITTNRARTGDHAVVGSAPIQNPKSKI